MDSAVSELALGLKACSQSLSDTETPGDAPEKSKKKKKKLKNLKKSKEFKKLKKLLDKEIASGRLKKKKKKLVGKKGAGTKGNQPNLEAFDVEMSASVKQAEEELAAASKLEVAPPLSAGGMAKLFSMAGYGAASIGVKDTRPAGEDQPAKDSLLAASKPSVKKSKISGSVVLVPKSNMAAHDDDDKQKISGKLSTSPGRNLVNDGGSDVSERRVKRRSSVTPDRSSRSRSADGIDRSEQSFSEPHSHQRSPLFRDGSLTPVKDEQMGSHTKKIDDVLSMSATRSPSPRLPKMRDSRSPVVPIMRDQRSPLRRPYHSPSADTPTGRSPSPRNVVFGSPSWQTGERIGRSSSRGVSNRSGGRGRSPSPGRSLVEGVNFHSGENVQGQNNSYDPVEALLRSDGIRNQSPVFRAGQSPHRQEYSQETARRGKGRRFHSPPELYSSERRLSGQRGPSTPERRQISPHGSYRVDRRPFSPLDTERRPISPQGVQIRYNSDRRQELYSPGRQDFSPRGQYSYSPSKLQEESAQMPYSESRGWSPRRGSSQPRTSPGRLSREDPQPWEKSVFSPPKLRGSPNYGERSFDHDNRSHMGQPADRHYPPSPVHGSGGPRTPKKIHMDPLLDGHGSPSSGRPADSVGQELHYRRLSASPRRLSRSPRPRSHSPLRRSASPHERRLPSSRQRSPSPRSASLRRHSPGSYHTDVNPHMRSFSPRHPPSSPRRKRSPGDRFRSPDRRGSPGRRIPGRRSPDRRSPGRRGSPGPGRRSPGRRGSPGRRSPARRSPLRRGSPGRGSPSRRWSPGRRASPGRRFSGHNSSRSPTRRRGAYSPRRSSSPRSGRRLSPASRYQRRSPDRFHSPGRQMQSSRGSYSPDRYRYRRSPDRPPSPPRHLTRRFSPSQAEIRPDSTMTEFDPKRMPPPPAANFQVPPPSLSATAGASAHLHRQPVDYGGSPKRLSLDERLERELGIKMEQQQEQQQQLMQRQMQPAGVPPLHHASSLPATVPTYDNTPLEEEQQHQRTVPIEKEQAMAAAQMVTTKLLEMQAAKEAERRQKREQRMAERQRQLLQSQEGGGVAAVGEQRVAAARILEQVEQQELASEEQKVRYFHFTETVSGKKYLYVFLSYEVLF